VALVVAVIFVFLRKFWATVIPSVALPLAIIGTFGVMKLIGFTLDNLSLMALTIATGFVVDDAIVMIENIVRFIELGETPMEAALKGAKQIGFTVISLTVSLIAVFIPLLFMTGIGGRFFREFAITLSLALAASAGRNPRHREPSRRRRRANAVSRRSWKRLRMSSASRRSSAPGR